ncbi:glycoside hydrolase family 43 protein [Pelagicoccus sp. SDUM812005]|uniref:glycoside hydrolase family 43 protein n=1 Tax=Pelagicoccus sp. SDUM812005 TaxID=3041257 RepID=UPI00280FA50A|nr:glycoside hydrolase family 43 protein [Pelagicoccus sp. SDUM812005]MDQ8182644.1 glycoside hydrolase family 43 protein [Pelagicoccus sp. SDUM812005]
MRLLVRATISLLCLCSAGAVVSGQTPSFTRNASVHDPSVIKVGDRFYVYGSHGASAWTEDLMNWTQVATSVFSGNPRHFSSFSSELSELVSWSQANTLWAADVYQLEDGKFYYYYNVWTNHLSYRSYMGLAVSDTIEGPYSNVGEILKGGTGVAGFDPAFDPNTIDPTLYRDTEDRLWMVYGSYSGGIFVLEMDDTTGFPKPGQEWGTKILNGRGALIEGPFIEYNAETKYFYLFLSYGGLNSNDDYNMRVFRSRQPDGPFLDPAGNDPATAPVSGWKDYGQALAGGWQFLPVPGELNQSPAGYLSPGHNSVIKDPDTGKWFNIFHTRFLGRGEGHEVRVHQFFFNEDGWPVMAPHRYAGETQGSYTSERVAGSYKTILHPKVINHSSWVPGGDPDPTCSEVVALSGDGSVSSADGDTWSMVDGRNIRITMDGALYKGVVCEQWDNENRMWVMGFTAVGPEGRSLWGSELALPDRSADLDPPELEAIADVALPMGDSLDLTLVNKAPNPELTLEYKILQAPEGLLVDSLTGAIRWTPLAAQMGSIHPVRIRVHDLFDPSLADEVDFSVYAAGGYELQEALFPFDAVGLTGISDRSGKRTGLTARLSGTGSGFAGNDPNLALDEASGQLELRSSQSDFNGQAGMGLVSAVGVNFSKLGSTGAEDFSVTATFAPIEGLGDVDQVGVFVGASATTLTRAGIFQGASPQGLAVHTQSGVDANASFDQSGYDLSDGLTVVIARESGQWSYLVDGVSVSPQAPDATFLDGLSDLTAGVFAINPLNANSKTVGVDSLRVAILSDELRLTRIQEWKTANFGENPADGIAGNDDDPDQDGRSNLVEYALGTNPTVGDADPNGKIELVDGKLVWTFTQLADPALSYAVRSSSTPGDRRASAVWSSSVGSNQEGPVAVEVAIPSEAGGKVFLQLEVDTVE